ncbi:hypothetical protein BH23ACT11_BH23ACT11_27990 [soil metagenome]
MDYQVGNDLPPGEYAAEVSLNGQVVETLDFTVYVPPLPVIAYPGRELPNAPTAATAEVRATNLQFVVDASGSMNEVVDGTPKIDAARAAMQSLVTALPDGNDAPLDVGLRAYSHREATEGDAACDDTELLVPMEGVKKGALREQIDSLQAIGGRTPMAASVEAAAGDFQDGNEENAIRLVSDGKENCNDDPVTAIKSAAESAGATVHVVGFDITESGARDQLQQIAESTGGIYVDAPTPEDLTEALYEIAEEQVEVVTVQSGAGEIVVDPPPGTELAVFTIYDADGKEVVSENGSAEDARGTYQLPAGTYTGDIRQTYYSSEQPGFRFEVGAGRETVLGLAGLQVRTRQEPWAVALVNQESALFHGQALANNDLKYIEQPMTVVPGTYTVHFRASTSSSYAPVAEDVEIQPKQVVTLEP